MGFTNKNVNIEALKATGGNVEAAIERLLNMLG
jgi:ubiquilin